VAGGAYPLPMHSSVHSIGGRSPFDSGSGHGVTDRAESLEGPPSDSGSGHCRWESMLFFWVDIEAFCLSVNPMIPTPVQVPTPIVHGKFQPSVSMMP
jgi:hypothetical protein